MLSIGQRISFAGNEWQRRYIEKTFQGIQTLHLDGYNINYGKQGRVIPSLITQVPGVLRTIRDEHQWLAALTAHHHFDGIISDNRYGLYHPAIPSVIITHQLQVQTGAGNGADMLLRKLHYSLLNRFSACWIPDMPEGPNLGGELSHPSRLPGNTSYLGWLSQMHPQPLNAENYLLVLLSGVEPQRTILSRLLWRQVQDYEGKVVFIEGSNEIEMPADIPPHITCYNRLTKEQLEPLVAGAGVVICRSGYSSVMDMVAMGKKAILIPTPRQTEQEYLARHLEESGIFYTAPQKGFNLSAVLSKASHFPFKKFDLRESFNRYKPVIDKWVKTI